MFDKKFFAVMTIEELKLVMKLCTEELSNRAEEKVETTTIVVECNHVFPKGKDKGKTCGKINCTKHKITEVKEVNVEQDVEQPVEQSVDQVITVRIQPQFVDEFIKRLGYEPKITREKKMTAEQMIAEFTDWDYSEYKPSNNLLSTMPMTRLIVKNETDRKKLGLALERTITPKTNKMWFPERPEVNEINNPDVDDVAGKYQSKYPIFVISKGRWEKRLTCDSLERMKMNYYLVVETQEYDNYAKYVDKSKIIKLPTDLPFNNSSIPARNYCWEKAIEMGYDYHWILDDNIDGFYRLNKNTRQKVNSGYFFTHIEDYVKRFNNVVQAGMNYKSFAVEIDTKRIITKNTRIYSCILIKNNIPKLEERWRGKYNEDTDLSLRILKLGYSTMLFNNYLCDKATTLTMKGGNETIYSGEGVRLKAESLVEQHPDVASVCTRFGRIHHDVDYKPFKNNPLKIL